MADFDKDWLDELIYWADCCGLDKSFTRDKKQLENATELCIPHKSSGALTTLPAELGKLQKLEKLSTGSNPIVSAQCLAELTNLKVLDLRKSRLLLPSKITNLQKL